ncbi:MAG: glycosyltransferase family 4 protein [Lachnospiraceae bacterium]|jgi:1,2-diacylglycerol 3-alpha-glucosyltransferase
MKILITTDCYLPVINGVVTSVCNLRKEMEERGHEVKILTLSSTGNSYRRQGVYYMKSVSVEGIYPGARVAVGSVNEIVAELIDWSPDIVHSQSEFTTYHYAVKISRCCRCPLIHTYHTVYEDYTHYFSPSETLGKKAVSLWTRTLLKKVSVVVAPTQKVQGLLKGYKVSAPIEVIPTGIALQKYTQQLPEEERMLLRKCLGIAPDQKVLVSVGRLAKEKNLEELLTYVSHRKERDLTLLLVGDGPHREKLERLAEQLGIKEQVVFTGMIACDRVWKYYQLGDVFVSASNSETQGLTYIEALASKVPALCRKDPCLDHVLIDGYNGYQYESEEEFFHFIDEMFSIYPFYLSLKDHAGDSVMEFSSWTFGNALERLYRKELGYVSHQHEVESGYGERTWGFIRSR